VSEQQEFIERFRRDDFGLDSQGRSTKIPEFVRSSFEQALGIVSKDLYSDDLHFVYELIQNAQDNIYSDGVTPNLKFILLSGDPTDSEGAEGCLCVVNNEVGFSDADIKSICSTGKSTKKLKKVEGFIGEKGIGFKSVFKVSSFPHIFSNGYHFCLLGEDKVTGLSFIIPYWVDDIPEIVRDNLESTCILLPLQKGKYRDIEASLKNHKPEVTLFLDKLRRLEIQIPSANYKAVFEETTEGDILRLSSAIGDGEKTVQKFLVSSKKVQVPVDLQEEKREDVTERTISIAFPLQKYRSLSVFAYLPTEMRSGLPFIINADFLLAANRESINKTEWNRWLFDELAKFVAAEIVRLAREDSIGPTVYGFIPTPTVNDESSGRFKVLATAIVTLLQLETFVKSTSGQLFQANVVRIASKELRSLFSAAAHQVEWLAEDLARYADGLRQVGVKTLRKEEEEAYYCQSEFVERQDDAWFVRYYQYLAQLTNRSPDSYPILPLEEGGLVTVGSLSTYYPIDSENSSVEIAGHFFPPIQVFKRSLFSTIGARTDSARILAILRLKKFSFADYFFEIVLPSVKDRVESASLPDKKSLIEFVLRWWDQLDIEESLLSSDYGLPILLGGGRLVLTSEVEQQLVYPEGYFSEGGWEQVFLDKEEKSKFCVLDSWYSTISEEKLDDYLSAIEVREYPEPLVEVQRGAHRPNEVTREYREYAKQLNDYFFYAFSGFQSTSQKSASLPLLPSAFWRCGSLPKSQYNVLIKYFNYLYSSKYEGASIRAILHWSYYGGKSKSVESPIDYYLENTRWLKTQHGFHRPSECFLDDPNLRQIFGNELPYVSAPVSDELLDYFGVRRDADTETIIDYLSQISGGSTVSVGAITGIYNALRERNDLDKTRFTESSLVYIPEINGRSAQWCTAAQVIWDDISDLTGDSIFESLQPHYPEALKYFFVSKLGVKESIDSSSYAELWLNLQATTRLSERDLRLYNKAFQNVRLAVKQKDKPDWLLEFKKSAKLYADSNRWVSPHEENAAFLPDLAPLRDEFSGKVPFIKRISDYSYEWMQPLVQFLGFECFSEVVREELITTKVRSLVLRNSYLSDFSLKLLVRLLANKVSEGREIVEKLKSDGMLSVLLNVRETEVDQIKVKLFIPHTEIFTITSNHSVFLHLEDRLLYIKRGVDSEDIKDELERLIINRVLQDISNRQEREAFEDSISNILGVVGDERFRKLSAKRPEWHIPRDILTFIDRLIKNRVPHKLELELQQIEKESETLPPLEPTEDIQLPEQELLGVRPRDTENLGDEQANGERNDDNTGHHVGEDGSSNDPSSPSRNGGEEKSKLDSSAHGSGSVQPDGRTSDNGSRSSSNVSMKSARSKNIASQVNQGRRSKLRSYVISDLTDDPADRDLDDTTEQAEYRKKLGEKAELIVLEDLKSKGFDAIRMPEGNPGYDIEATNSGTGELIFIEVKGDSYRWSDKGVGISTRQYETGLKQRSSFYLAVVDNLSSVPSSPHYIRDPISYITEYRFDSGWSELATPILSVQADVAAGTVLDRLLGYTEIPDCQELISYCDEMAYPFPDIGAELQGEDGSVVLEDIELLWENERIIVFVSEEQVAAAEEYRRDWRVFLAAEQRLIKSALDKTFSESN
jgi:hypothetical protein